MSKACREPPGSREIRPFPAAGPLVASGMPTLRIFLIGTCLLLVRCAPGSGAASGQMGDLPEEEPAAGGISEVPNPTPEMAKSSGKPLETLQRGHVVYMLKCAECHVYMLPQDLFVDEWEDALPKMITHAGLGSADEKAVLDYVVAVGTAD